MSVDEFDIGGLDWTAHLLPHERRRTGPGLHLAEAFSRIGRIMIGYWGGDHIRNIAQPPPCQDVPLTLLAFDGDTPVNSVHATWAPIVRSIVSPGRWRSIERRLKDPHRWLAEHIPDPEGGVPIHPEDLRARLGQDRDDPISPDNWQAAWEAGSNDRAMRIADRRAIDHSLNALVDLTRSGVVGMIGVVESENEPIQIDGCIWHGDYAHRLTVLARCQVDLPTGPASSASQAAHIFLDEGFEAAFKAHAVKYALPILDPHHRYFDGVDPMDEFERWLDGNDDKRPLTRYPDIEKRARDYLTKVLREPGRDVWRVCDVVPLMQAHPDFGNGRKNLNNIIEAVARDLATDPEYAFLTKAGQPRKGVDRPSKMAHGQILHLIKGGQKSQ